MLPWLPDGLSDSERFAIAAMFGRTCSAMPSYSVFACDAPRAEAEVLSTYWSRTVSNDSSLFCNHRILGGIALPMDLREVLPCVDLMVVSMASNLVGVVVAGADDAPNSPN